MTTKLFDKLEVDGVQANGARSDDDGKFLTFNRGVCA